jgi:hypothetical protein
MERHDRADGTAGEGKREASTFARERGIIALDGDRYGVANLQVGGDQLEFREVAAGEEQGFSSDRAVHGIGSGDRRSRPDDDVQRRTGFSHGV